MSTLQTYYPGQQAIKTNQSVFTRFFNWCAAQETNRLGWLGLMLALHGCVLTPSMIFVVVNSGNDIILFSMTMAAMAMVLITNLAALPTKITIPVFALSILLDISVLIIALKSLLA